MANVDSNVLMLEMILKMCCDVTYDVVLVVATLRYLIMNTIPGWLTGCQILRRC